MAKNRLTLGFCQTRSLETALTGSATTRWHRRHMRAHTYTHARTSTHTSMCAHTDSHTCTHILLLRKTKKHLICFVFFLFCTCQTFNFGLIIVSVFLMPAACMFPWRAAAGVSRYTAHASNWLYVCAPLFHFDWNQRPKSPVDNRIVRDDWNEKCCFKRIEWKSPSVIWQH